MKSFSILQNSEIMNALRNHHRQYLVGTLQNPQDLNHISDTEIEVGITSYQEWAIEPTHFHTRNTEYMYMLEGETKYLNLETGEEHHFTQGDFFVIRKNIRYAQKSLPHTSLIFFKYPGGNDKVITELDKKTRSWLASWQADI